MWVALRRLLQLLLQGAGPVPQHIAFIMDGNRRFADQEHMDRLGGHTAGYKKVGGAGAALALAHPSKPCTATGVATLSFLL